MFSLLQVRQTFRQQTPSLPLSWWYSPEVAWLNIVYSMDPCHPPPIEYNIRNNLIFIVFLPAYPRNKLHYKFRRHIWKESWNLDLFITRRSHLNFQYYFNHLHYHSSTIILLLPTTCRPRVPAWILCLRGIAALDKMWWFVGKMNSWLKVQAPCVFEFRSCPCLSFHKCYVLYWTHYHNHLNRFPSIA